MNVESPNVSIQLSVADLGTTEAFYAGILQLPVQRAFTMRGSPEHLIMKQEGWELIFVEEATLNRLHPVQAWRLAEYPKGVGMTLHFRVEEIEDIADILDDEFRRQSPGHVEEPLQIAPHLILTPGIFGKTCRGWLDG